MLRPSKDLQDPCFDDEAGAIRHRIVDTGSWLFSRKVLISPVAAGKPERTARPDQTVSSHAA